MFILLGGLTANRSFDDGGLWFEEEDAITCAGLLFIGCASSFRLGDELEWFLDCFNDVEARLAELL